MLGGNFLFCLPTSFYANARENNDLCTAPLMGWDKAVRQYRPGSGPDLKSTGARCENGKEREHVNGNCISFHPGRWLQIFSPPSLLPKIAHFVVKEWCELN